LAAFTLSAAGRFYVFSDSVDARSMPLLTAAWRLANAIARCHIFGEPREPYPAEPAPQRATHLPRPAARSRRTGSRTGARN